MASTPVPFGGRRTSWIPIAIALTTAACGPAEPGGDPRGDPEAPEHTVTFLDRTIDLEPYVQGFPYSRFNADFDSEHLFYFHETPEGRFLMVQDLQAGPGSGMVDVERGARLHDVDWSTRNFFGMEYDTIRGNMIVYGDERNDEVVNLYRMSLEDGSMERITDVPYIYGSGFDHGNERIGYVGRFGESEPYRNCLFLMDPSTGEQDEVLCEEGSEFRMVWTAVNFSPDNEGVVLNVNRDGHRAFGNLAWIDLTAEEPAMEVLLPTEVSRFYLISYDGWTWENDRVFYYASDESGFSNLYRYDLESRASRQLTQVTEDASFIPFEVDGRRLWIVSYGRPHETEWVVVDVDTGEELGRYTWDASVRPSGVEETAPHFFVSTTSTASPYQMDEIWIRIEEDQALFDIQPKLRLPQHLAAAIEQCDVERVEYPTFDVDPVTGEPRMLHAFLMTPKRPRENPEERLAVMTAFYGGSNYFDNRQQIFCEAGISWLSPAVRGSDGFGKEFGALNDGDLGGDEIIDLFYGARFLEEKLGLEPRQIGVAGGSHGGFATMRALTFPPKTNGRNESYELGFGISHAGFSSIVTFYDATNIPDWVILEAGDPSTEREKLLDRSPLTHVNRLDSPLLLTHGSNDNRVEVTESRQFNEAAMELGKPVTYVEFEGQGHSIKGLDNLVRWYQVQFELLEKVVVGEPPVS
jgi:dipeptidyl aminopeptidase/acylaminoacyl peptidase